MTKSILQNEKRCFISGSTTGLQRHHIYFGANRRISEENGFYVWLIPEYHNMSDYGVHFDKAFDLKLKQDCQRKYEETHSREEFIALIGRSYL